MLWASWLDRSMFWTTDWTNSDRSFHFSCLQQSVIPSDSFPRRPIGWLQLRWFGRDKALEGIPSRLLQPVWHTHTHTYTSRGNSDWFGATVDDGNLNLVATLQRQTSQERSAVQVDFCLDQVRYRHSYQTVNCRRGFLTLLKKATSRHPSCGGHHILGWQAAANTSRNNYLAHLKPQSHRIVRFLDRTSGCDWAMVRPIGSVCYDLQQRSHTAIDLYAWSRYHDDWRISKARSIVGNCATSGSDQRPMYDQWLRSTTDRTINRRVRRPIVRSIVTSDRAYDQ